MNDDDAGEVLPPTAYALALGFDSDDPEFVRGVQIGMVWARLDPSTTILVYARNAEMLARMLDTHPGAFTVEQCDMYTTEGVVARTYYENPDDEWLAVHFDHVDTDVDT